MSVQFVFCIVDWKHLTHTHTYTLYYIYVQHSTIFSPKQMYTENKNRHLDSSALVSHMLLYLKYQYVLRCVNKAFLVVFSRSFTHLIYMITLLLLVSFHFFCSFIFFSLIGTMAWFFLVCRFLYSDASSYLSIYSFFIWQHISVDTI